jgi:serine/threonine-protein kinase RsbW
MNERMAGPENGRAGLAGEDPVTSPQVCVETSCNESVIPNNLLAIAGVRSRILSEVMLIGFEDFASFGLSLAVTEALVNAYAHGNRRDPRKRIFVRFEVNAEFVVVEIADEGNGFDPDLVADPTENQHLGRDHGRGILMMKAFSDEVKYDRGGTRVRLTKRAEPAGDPGLDGVPGLWPAAPTRGQRSVR